MAQKSVVIVCDGSSLGNGKETMRAAAVALLGFKGKWKAVGRYLGHATNQQAEIAAATIALESLKEPCRVRLISDSRYVIETMSGRFRKKSNHEWWDSLDRAAENHQIQWEWTRGHAGEVLQEACDKAAKSIASVGRVDDKILSEAVETAQSNADDPSL
jgi:ribonuclease HI